MGSQTLNRREYRAGGGGSVFFRLRTFSVSPGLPGLLVHRCFWPVEVSGTARVWQQVLHI